MSKATIISKARSMSEQIAKTVVETAKEIAMDFWNVYGNDASKDDITELATAIGGDVPARVSEWRAFFRAVPYGLVEALGEYPKHDTLTRVKLFALCRELPKHDYSQFRETVKAFVKGLNAKSAGKPKTPEQKLGMGLGVIKNIQTRSAKLKAFRRDLAKLCEKHGINY